MCVYFDLFFPVMYTSTIDTNGKYNDLVYGVLVFEKGITIIIEFTSWVSKYGPKTNDRF